MNDRLFEFVFSLLFWGIVVFVGWRVGMTLVEVLP